MGTLVRFNRVLNVGDRYVKVVTITGDVLTIKAPHDKELKMNEPFNGEGSILISTNVNFNR